MFTQFHVNHINPQMQQSMIQNRVYQLQEDEGKNLMDIIARLKELSSDVHFMKKLSPVQTSVLRLILLLFDQDKISIKEIEAMILNVEMFLIE